MTISKQYFSTLIEFQISLWVSGTEYQTEERLRRKQFNTDTMEPETQKQKCVTLHSHSNMNVGASQAQKNIYCVE
jgi:hypothetical protein